MPEKDLEGMNMIQYKSTKLEIKSASDITENYIADIRFKFKVAYFNYKKAKAKWKALFNLVDSIVQKPVVYDAEKLN